MKNPTYLETVARNHARVAAMMDKRTADMLARGAGVEDLTLRGEVDRSGEVEAVKVAVVKVVQPDGKQGELFL